MTCFVVPLCTGCRWIHLSYRKVTAVVLQMCIQPSFLQWIFLFLLEMPCLLYAMSMYTFFMASSHGRFIVTLWLSMTPRESSLRLSHLSSSLKKFLLNPEVHTLTFCSNQTVLPIYLTVSQKGFNIWVFFHVSNISSSSDFKSTPTSYANVVNENITSTGPKIDPWQIHSNLLLYSSPPFPNSQFFPTFCVLC